MTKKENFLYTKLYKILFFFLSGTHSGTTTDQKVKEVSSACNDSAFNKQYTSIPPTSFGDGVMAHQFAQIPMKAQSWKKSCTYN